MQWRLQFINGMPMNLAMGNNTTGAKIMVIH